MTMTSWEPPAPTRIAWPRGIGESGLPAIADAVLAYLIDRGEPSTTVTNVEISAACRMAPRTANKALGILEAAGKITRDYDPSIGGPGAPGRRIRVHTLARRAEP